MATEAATKKKKARILSWRGVLANDSRVLRWMIAIVLTVAGAALTFTQLGFVDLVMPDGTVGYMVVLLQVVALGALLLGTLPGVAIGFMTGSVLLLHAHVFPLDHYELTFVNPMTSIVMFSVCGLLFGALFAFVLRNNPSSKIKRAIYIIIVCIIVSFLYSVGFTINVFIQLVISIANELGPDASEAGIRTASVGMALQLGDLSLQGQSTAFVMAVLCIAGDLVACKIRERVDVPGLRTVFGTWLAVVVALAFMVMSAASFAVSSVDELRDAEDLLKSEVSYIGNQLKLTNTQIDLISRVFEQYDVDYDTVDTSITDKLTETLQDDMVLKGYTVKDDGTVITTLDDYIFATNDDRFATAQQLKNVFSTQVLDAIDRSIQTGEMQRVVFEDAKTLDSALEGIINVKTRTFIAYVYAEEFAVEGVLAESGAQEQTTENDGSSAVSTQKVIMIQSSDQVFAKRSSVMVWMTLSALVLLLVVFALVSQLLNRVVARRVDETNDVLARVTDGDLDARVDIHDTREFGSLSDGINTTVDALKGWIAEAETRMDAELATARAIQEAVLPRTFPPYPDVLKFDIYASMNAAKQVGGDFYDFFLIGDDCDDKTGKLGFVVADVSGKGVPAALFMMRAKALLRDFVASGMELGEAVAEANRQLVDGNDAGMFVTTWVGVLDYGSGHVDYVNAGHNPPLLWQREGGWRWMRDKSGPVLGLFDMTYRAHSVDCKPGDMFLLYTDGVTEAFNVDEELYGEERLMTVAEEGYRLHARELLESVRKDVASYAQGAEQSDDITILTLEVGVPPEVTGVLEVPAELAQLNTVNDFLHEELDNRLCPQRVQNQLDIAVEELFVNVCKYAYADAAPDVPRIVRIYRTYTADPPSITVVIIDKGVAFDPLAKPDAVTPDNIMDVPIGGLGILMAKKSVNEMSYEREGGSNVVTIVKKW